MGQNKERFYKEGNKKNIRFEFLNLRKEIKTNRRFEYLNIWI